MNTIFDLLEADHREVKQLMKKAEDDPSLMAKIEQELDVHTRFEEEIFYVEAEAVTGMKEEIQDDLEEHQEAKEMLEKLSKLKAGGKEWTSALRELADALDHHIKDEETKLFPEARKKIDVIRSEEMTEQYMVMKEKAKAA
ncbi:MAG: hemerythrin domain-containing protein [Rhodospirillales bacterium]|nr:hemerythrin domain-containing protein [Rhodospirillales bacterium]